MYIYLQNYLFIEEEIEQICKKNYEEEKDNQLKFDKEIFHNNLNDIIDKKREIKLKEFNQVIKVDI